MAGTPTFRGTSQDGWGPWVTTDCWDSWENERGCLALASFSVGQRPKAVVLHVNNPPQLNSGSFFYLLFPACRGQLSGMSLQRGYYCWPQTLIFAVQDFCLCAWSWSGEVYIIPHQVFSVVRVNCRDRVMGPVIRSEERGSAGAMSPRRDARMGSASCISMRASHAPRQ